MKHTLLKVELNQTQRYCCYSKQASVAQSSTERTVRSLLSLPLKAFVTPEHSSSLQPIKLIFVRKISHIFTFHTRGRQHFPFLYIGEWSGACLLVQLFTICAIRQQHPTAVSSPSAAPHISLLKTSPVDQKVFLPQMKEGTSEGGSNEPAKIATESTFLTSKVWHRSPSPHLPY